MLKLSENPPLVLPGIESLLDVQGDWWVAHTKARAEKAFAWEMLSRNVPYFLPMTHRTAIWGGRKRKVITPIFPSYVFFSGDNQTRHDALLTDRLCQTIGVKNSGPFVREIDAIYRAIQSNQEFVFFPHAALGQRCRVTQGALRGIEGTVVQNEDITRLILQVSMLGQGAALEISADLLEPIETAEDRKTSPLQSKPLLYGGFV